MSIYCWQDLNHPNQYQNTTLWMKCYVIVSFPPVVYRHKEECHKRMQLDVKRCRQSLHLGMVTLYPVCRLNVRLFACIVFQQMAPSTFSPAADRKYGGRANKLRMWLFATVETIGLVDILFNYSQVSLSIKTANKKVSLFHSIYVTSHGEQRQALHDGRH